ncbi:hypothetical protein CONPUDRAFT_148473 [Coniophora puteana RWD-64-598 SS2]|uniref:Uncharacterized protein n=1 Tax=Coniophora puteana (strain RWD-64-598) TaxID=741705 RepID=A0A5M3N4M8_CONPW|nr:uncharacterized protein CONPUDRAFT_148473 [Coniophora puteana RWD-64-598 SS2]EIW86380.1 hypothetical protein CONPUDRAFT_148473 [Coniophora puteana RWD-64-598 SS2]
MNPQDQHAVRATRPRLSNSQAHDFQATIDALEAAYLRIRQIRDSIEHLRRTMPTPPSGTPPDDFQWEIEPDGNARSAPENATSASIGRARIGAGNSEAAGGMGPSHAGIVLAGAEDAEIERRIQRLRSIISPSARQRLEDFETHTQRRRGSVRESDAPRGIEPGAGSTSTAPLSVARVPPAAATRGRPRSPPLPDLLLPPRPAPANPPARSAIARFRLRHIGAATSSDDPNTTLGAVVESRSRAGTGRTNARQGTEEGVFHYSPPLPSDPAANPVLQVEVMRTTRTRVESEPSAGEDPLSALARIRARRSMREEFESLRPSSSRVDTEISYTSTSLPPPHELLMSDPAGEPVVRPPFALTQDIAAHPSRRLILLRGNDGDRQSLTQHASNETTERLPRRRFATFTQDEQNRISRMRQAIHSAGRSRPRNRNIWPRLNADGDEVPWDDPSGILGTLPLQGYSHYTPDESSQPEPGHLQYYSPLEYGRIEETRQSVALQELFANIGRPAPRRPQRDGSGDTRDPPAANSVPLMHVPLPPPSGPFVPSVLPALPSDMVKKVAPLGAKHARSIRVSSYASFAGR